MWEEGRKPTEESSRERTATQRASETRPTRFNIYQEAAARERSRYLRKSEEIGIHQSARLRAVISKRRISEESGCTLTTLPETCVCVCVCGEDNTKERAQQQVK